jgi:hypothetical protein
MVTLSAAAGLSAVELTHLFARSSSTAEEALEVAGKAAAEDLAAAADMAAVRRGGKPALTRLKSPRVLYE